MKRIALTLVLALALSGTALAEASAADDFLANLSKTWDSFVRMTDEAGKGISEWAEKSGVKQWAEGAANDVNTWFNNSGLSEWAQGALSEINGWIDQSGIREWTQQTAVEFQAFVDKNGPAIEAWLQQAGQEVATAMNMLTDPEGHTQTELQQAYQTVSEALAEASQPTQQPQE